MLNIILFIEVICEKIDGNDAEVTCLFSGFSGDPRAYLIKNTVIALRTEDAKNIIIQKGENT